MATVDPPSPELAADVRAGECKQRLGLQAVPLPRFPHINGCCL